MEKETKNRAGMIADPAGIEAESMRLISRELAKMGVSWKGGE